MLFSETRYPVETHPESRSNRLKRVSTERQLPTHCKTFLDDLANYFKDLFFLIQFILSVLPAISQNVIFKKGDDWNTDKSPFIR